MDVDTLLGDQTGTHLGLLRIPDFTRIDSICYGLWDNYRQAFRSIDPRFTLLLLVLAAPVGAGAVTLLDVPQVRSWIGTVYS